MNYRGVAIVRRFDSVDWSKKLIGTGCILADVLVLCARIYFLTFSLSLTIDSLGEIFF